MSKKRTRAADDASASRRKKQKTAVSQKEESKVDSANECERLLNILKQYDGAGDRLYKEAIKQLKSGSHQIDIIDIFPASKFPQASVQAAVHCVRCHEKFAEKNNLSKSCRIEHSGETDDCEKHYDRYNRKRVFYRKWTMCCGKQFDSQSPCDEPTGFCFEGKHTTDAKQVDYEDSTAETCQEYGCTK